MSFSPLKTASGKEFFLLDPYTGTYKFPCELQESFTFDSDLVKERNEETSNVNIIKKLKKDEEERNMKGRLNFQ